MLLRHLGKTEMIIVAELDQIAAARLEDSRVLHAAGRFDGALYVCGYAVEIALKARICRTLNWTGFPSTRSDFEGYGSFKTHDLDILLRLSGQEFRIKQNQFADWNAVSVWRPESRYNIIGTANATEAAAMIAAAAALLSNL